MGSPHLFPPSTTLSYGKGTGIFPGYPENEASNLDAADFANRECVAVECGELQVGPFPAKDFYGDGSFYLLDTPGHWPGHMCGLARTSTSPDTFVFLGGDICHFSGDFRPSQWVPLPDTVPEDAFRGVAARYPLPCSCSFFTDHHPQLYAEARDANTTATAPFDKQKTPFYDLSTHKTSSYKDPPLATATMGKMQEFFDADPNVLVCLSHDPTLLDYLPTLNDNPEKDLNSWKEQGLKEKCHWGWLAELPQYGKDGSVVGHGYRDMPIVEGHWKDGKRITLS
jgi:glyoxylase-like metal-dependent hydrolase (beta-lactamase superfamily II)